MGDGSGGKAPRQDRRESVDLTHMLLYVYPGRKVLLLLLLTTYRSGG
jgi:hypothetical protein